MSEWLKETDCKSVEIFLIVGSNPTFFNYSSKYNAVGSVSVLGTESHVFKSHYFENFFNIFVDCLKVFNKFVISFL